jgi:hypothetical protein
MPIVDWAFLCDKASVDVSGKLTIIGAFRNLNAHTLPFSHPQMFVALGLKLAPEEDYEVSTTIISPTGKEIARLGATRARGEAEHEITTVVIFRYHETTFSETGEHRIEIFLNGNSVRSLPLTIGLLPRGVHD